MSGWPNDQGIMQPKVLAHVIKDYVKAIVRKRPNPPERTTVGSFNYEFGDVAGGDYNLGDIIDVAIITPLNGQVIKYDSASGKWINGTNTAVVAIRSFSNAASYETLTGRVDGTNLEYTTGNAYQPTAGTTHDLEVYMNGVLQTLDEDYEETTPATGVFTMLNYYPDGNDVIIAKHQ